MEDKKMKPSKPAKEVSAGLRKAQASAGSNNNPGFKSSSKRTGTNRGPSGAQGK